MAPPVISTSTFVMVVRMLAVLCSNSPAIAVQLLRQSKFCIWLSLFHCPNTPNAAYIEQTQGRVVSKQSFIAVVTGQKYLMYFIFIGPLLKLFSKMSALECHLLCQLEETTIFCLWTVMMCFRRVRYNSVFVAGYHRAWRDRECWGKPFLMIFCQPFITSLNTLFL